MIHLGAPIDTLRRIVKPTPDKMQEIIQVLQGVLADVFIPAGHPQRVVSLIAACHTTITTCLFWLRTISSQPSRYFKKSYGTQSKRISLDVPEVL